MAETRRATGEPIGEALGFEERITRLEKQGEMHASQMAMMANLIAIHASALAQLQRAVIDLQTRTLASRAAESRK